MEIGKIERGMSNISVSGKIVEIGEPREVMTKFGRRRVADAFIEDASGKIKMSLWEKQIDEVKEGDTVKISGAYVTEFRDELQLNVPTRGKIEVID